ncbi:MAG TPA: hypothetical protein PLU50_09955, partial [Pseudobdellovibrionaceae bacterium]|nr:hypothetical protein [Pseudobdellovibrionaceae bacterium]
MRILKYLHSLLVTISLLALSNSGQADSGLDLRASPSWIRGPDFIRQIDLATPQWVLHTNSSNSNFYSLQRMTVEDKVLSMNRPECAVEYFPGRAEEVVETQ